MPRGSGFPKAISDPIYGSIPLTQVELDVIDTSVFQRLRRVGQLGLVSLVFPSATYSRFIHSIGAAHVLGEILDRLRVRRFSPDWQLYRLAMILHDVGHYPLAHATEHAVEDYYSSVAFPTTDHTVGVAPDVRTTLMKHEEVGGKVLTLDPELRDVLSKYELDPNRVESVFTRAAGTESIYSSLVSSDLDADRLDYLRRSSQATGLPYGSVDLDFILRNIVLRKAGSPKDDAGLPKYVCVKDKALRAVDHFLISRMFDYLQVVYQKSVVGFEQMLQAAVRHLLQHGTLDLTEEAVCKAIPGNEWPRWDDAWLWGKLHEEHQRLQANAPTLAMYCIGRLIARRPADVLYMRESVISSGGRRGIDELKRRAMDMRIQVDKSDTLRGGCILWSPNPFTIMSKPSRVRDDVDPSSGHDGEKVVRILSGRRILPITQCNGSIARALSTHEYFMVRAYWVGSDEARAAAKAEVTRIAQSCGLEKALR